MKPGARSIFKLQLRRCRRILAIGCQSFRLGMWAVVGAHWARVTIRRTCNPAIPHSVTQHAAIHPLPTANWRENLLENFIVITLVGCMVWFARFLRNDVYVCMLQIRK